MIEEEGWERVKQRQRAMHRSAQAKTGQNMFDVDESMLWM